MQDAGIKSADCAIERYAQRCSIGSAAGIERMWLIGFSGRHRVCRYGMTIRFPGRME